MNIPRLAGRLVATGLLASLLAGCITINTPLSGHGRAELDETTISGQGQNKILWLPINGFISAHGASRAFGLAQSDSTLTQVERTLDKAENDHDIKALVLRINSPGGTVAASDEIYHRIQTYHERTGVPVIASLGGIAASGGYYVAMSASNVIAAPTTITGSIGVIILDVNAAGLLDKLGLTDQTVTSGPHKDLLSPLRPPEPEEKAIVGRLVNSMYQRFVSVVTTNRPHLDRSRLTTITDGRIFSAPDALSLGLVDAIGYREDAIAAARNAAGLSSARVVRYYPAGATAPDTLSANAQAASGAAASGPLGELLSLAGASQASALPLYLWRATPD